MKFIATIALLVTASSQVRIENVHEGVPPFTALLQESTQELTQTKTQEQVNAEAIAKLTSRVDSMEEELWGVWNKLRDIAKSNPTVANVWHKAESNPLV